MTPLETSLLLTKCFDYYNFTPVIITLEWSVYSLNVVLALKVEKRFDPSKTFKVEAEYFW